jgi:pimeloyl-ACP methyl ester carboxylesterase
MAFESFLIEDVATPGAMIHSLRRGTGPPLLLLHGYPQTHFIWHKVADRLAERYTVVLTDLRGYGDSWSAPHFLVHLKWEFVNRSYIRNQDYIMTRWPVLLSSQDELNSLGVA